ncbi:hypothetical protein [Azospirillum argentinense]|uniref:hypothetical protein n=1 Tax=Azospirillum argentinense TaxID=2970906 RepID=UPI0010C003FA|nr:hypothetical protein [Azospirillum argentinense]
MSPRLALFRRLRARIKTLPPWAQAIDISQAGRGFDLHSKDSLATVLCPGTGELALKSPAGARWAEVAGAPLAAWSLGSDRAHHLDDDDAGGGDLRSAERGVDSIHLTGVGWLGGVGARVAQANCGHTGVAEVERFKGSLPPVVVFSQPA